jgi:hypoxanthine phosphoribosyltransferase
MSENVHVMLTEEEVAGRIKELGKEISGDYEGRELLVVGILKGAAFFATELAKRITVPVRMEFMSTSSYGSSTVSSGTVKIKQDIETDVAGMNVLIAEDIIDSGRTLAFLLDYFKKKGAESVRIATLLDKPDRREVDVNVDYNGFTIPDEFVVGYGLDYDQKYRNLPYIGILELD